MNFYKKSSGKNPEDCFSPYLTLADEATAFATTDNESRVQAAFSRLSEGKTVIMIAHRLSTVTNVDQIFVIQDVFFARPFWFFRNH